MAQKSGQWPKGGRQGHGNPRGFPKQGLCMEMSCVLAGYSDSLMYEAAETEFSFQALYGLILSFIARF